MTNKEFLQRYVDGMYVEGAYGRMAYKNGRIISYETPICDINRVNKTADVNIRKYSATTSRMQNNLLAILRDAGYTITTYDGPGAYMWDACDRRTGGTKKNRVKPNPMIGRFVGKMCMLLKKVNLL